MPTATSTVPPALKASLREVGEGPARCVLYEAGPEVGSGESGNRPAETASAPAPAPAQAQTPPAAHSPTPVLLIHSINAAASAAEVRPLFDALRGERLVAAPDLPGYGLSPREAGPYTPRRMTDAVIAAARWTSAQACGQPIHAIGVSLGTEFLARAAVEAPGLFATLTLISPTGLKGGQNLRGPAGSTRFIPMADGIIRGPGWGDKGGGAGWGAWLFRQLTRPGVIRYFLRRTWGSRTIDEALWAYDVQSARAPGAEHAPLAFLSGGLFSADIHTIYEAITSPVHVIHGTRGDFTNYRALPLPGCRAPWTVQVMQGCGALPHFERLDEVMAGWRRLVTPTSPPSPKPHPNQPAAGR